jgi:phosphopantothenoylcysteine decarboxylase/phosphopantothenate--cysteine ligase
VVTSVGAEVSHLWNFDAVVVAPATLNTLGKCAAAISDNAVTLLIAGQLGRRAPLMFVPAMNSILFAHPLYAETKQRLSGWGAVFFESPQEEDRLKMPEPTKLADAVIALVNHAS